MTNVCPKITALRLSNRECLLAFGGVVLFAYGWTANSLPWDLGELLGLYRVFLSNGSVSLLVGFRQAPSLAVVGVGALIVLGGVIILMAKV